MGGLFATAATVAMGNLFKPGLAGASGRVAGVGPYGPLGTADEHGIRLPEGFIAREIARSGSQVPGTGQIYHAAPDGGATFGAPVLTTPGGWIYVSNSEVDDGGGGVGAIVFGPTGAIVGARTILSGTSRNCAGGSTPWGTWLSCEEVDDGLVWECDPSGRLPALPRPGLGTFTHEAAVVDPDTGIAYLTEDESDGLFYRFRPVVQGTLLLGTLEAARVAANGSVTWVPIPEPNTFPSGTPTRHQVEATSFDRGEGMWFDSGTAYFCTTGDDTVWGYDAGTDRVEAVFRSADVPDSPLHRPDNICVANSGDIFVCEDSDNREIVIITPTKVAPFLHLVGDIHDGSELTGVAFNPAGNRMYFSSQRAHDAGATYEVSGLFRA